MLNVKHQKTASQHPALLAQVQSAQVQSAQWLKLPNFPILALIHFVELRLDWQVSQMWELLWEWLWMWQWQSPSYQHFADSQRALKKPMKNSKQQSEVNKFCCTYYLPAGLNDDRLST